jgi:hypothetical protein
MSLPSRRKLSAVAALVIGIGMLPFAGGTGASAAPAASSVTTRHIKKADGTASYKPSPNGSGLPAALNTEIPKAFGPEAQEGADAAANAAAARAAAANTAGPNRSLSSKHGARAGAASVVASASAPGGVIRNGPQVLTSFDGINHRDQRLTNGGNQFSLEPPDQALCVGGGHVVEAVNDAVRVRGTDGSAQTGVVGLNPFFGYPPAIDRTTGLQGPFVTDPSCLYDPTTRTFFLVILTLEVVPETGDFTGDNHLDIAVAQDPTKTWTIYRLDVTDDGRAGTPVHPHCPCIGDYPHVGVDAHGFYITTNEYSFFGPEFNSAQIYAFSKRALARGDADVLVTQFDTTGADRGFNGFTIWPAQSPSTGDYAREADGTEFFLSSNAAEEANGVPGGSSSTSIVTWSLTNTESLGSARPNPALHNTRVGVSRYAIPPKANQKPGPFPLGQCLNDPACATVILRAPDPFAPEVESPLDANDTRMQQVTYTDGKLYGALDTAVSVGGATKAGVGWYIVRPQSRQRSVDARLLNQGQLGLAGNNLIYPAIGVNANGKGVMAFTLAGDGYFPTAAFAAFDGRAGAGAIFVAAFGNGPQDGFSGYKPFGNPPGTTRPRWGDYGATAVAGDTIWIASEYIGQTCTLAQYQAAPFGSCGGTRTALANWGTRISQIKP